MKRRWYGTDTHLDPPDECDNCGATIEDCECESEPDVPDDSPDVDYDTDRDCDSVGSGRRS